jgi:hypothetical protein
MVKHRLDFSDSTSAMLFGVLATMITISSLALASKETEETALIIAITAISINIAHGALHGYLYIFERGFEKGKFLKYGHSVKNSKDRDAAISSIEEDLNKGSLEQFSDELKRAAAIEIYEKAKLQKTSHISRKNDYIGGIVKGFLVFIIGIVVVWPLLLIPSLSNAILVSFSIAIICLGILGWFYAEYVGRNRFFMAIGLIVVGFLIVIITVILGG